MSSEDSNRQSKKKQAARKTPVARLTLIIDFNDEQPARDEIERILDTAREYGGVRSAVFETLQLTKQELK